MSVKTITATDNEEQRQLMLWPLYQLVREGLDQLERGEVVSAADAFAAVEEDLSISPRRAVSAGSDRA